MHFLDTDVCIEFLRGRLRFGYRHMRDLGASEFSLPSIVVAELLFGAEHSPRSQKELRIVEEFISSFPITNFDVNAAREYARIRALLSKEGNLIGDRDMMIAATSIAHGATLVTRNMKDFGRIQGFRFEVWDEIAWE